MPVVTNVGQPVAAIDVGSGVTSGSFASFSPNAGSTYVVDISFDTDNSGTAATITVSWSSGGSGTWTVAKFDQQNGFINGQAIWYVIMPSAPGASVINVASNAHISGFVATVNELTGVDPVTPVGTIVTDHTTSDHAITLTPNRDGSIVFAALGDRNESSTVTQGNMNSSTTLLAAGTALNGLGETFFVSCSNTTTTKGVAVTLGQQTATLTGTSQTAVEFQPPLVLLGPTTPPDTFLDGATLLGADGEGSGDSILGFMYQASPYLASTGPQSLTQTFNAGLSFTSSDTNAITTGLTLAVLSFTSSDAFKTIKSAFAAALSFTSSDAFRTGKLLTAGLSFTSSQTHAVSKTISAGLSFTSSQARAIFTHLVVAVLSFTGALTKQTIKSAFAATLSFTGSLATASVHHFTQALNATLSFTSSQSHQIGKLLTGGLSFTSSQTHAIGKLIPTAVLSFTSTQTRRITHGLPVAVLSFTSSLALKTSRTLTATLSFTGSLAAKIVLNKAFTASLSFTSSQARSVGKSLTASLGFTSSQLHGVAKVTAATLSFTSSQTHRIVKGAFTATFSFTSSLVSGHFLTKLLTATLSFTSSLATGHLFTKVLTATLSFTSSQTRRVGHLIAPVLSFTSSQSNAIKKTLTATLANTGIFSMVPHVAALVTNIRIRVFGKEGPAGISGTEGIRSAQGKEPDGTSGEEAGTP